MADEDASSSAKRIDQALARIEAAAQHLASTNGKLTNRNAALRESLSGALASLDAFLDQRPG